MRALVSIYLAAVFAAGPWLCCCAGDFLIGKPAGAGSVTPAMPEAPPSCCRYKQPPTVPMDDRPMTPAKCSCQQDRPDAILTSSDNHQAVAVAFFAPGLSICDVSSSLLVLTTTASRGGSPAPSRSPGEILRALHILRC